jgi:hypothetical protein
LRDIVARSPRYYETNNTNTDFQFVLRVVTVGDNTMSAGAMVLTLKTKDSELFFNVWATKTGYEKASEQAADIMAAVDDYLSKLTTKAQ